jgi:hypothetical protein
MATTTTSTSSTPRRRRSAPRPITPISGFVCPREDLQGRVRDGTVTLLDDCLDTFELYRRVAATSDDRTHRRRALGQPDELRKALALDSDEYAAYHAAILRLRAWCEQDPDSAAREMVALTIAQVEQDLRCAAAKRVLTDASRWQAVNDAKVRAVTWLYTARDELVAGLGWPHPGEEVIVQTTYTAGVGKRAEQVTYDGPAWYATSFNTMNTMHSVSVVDALDHAHVVWTPLRDGNHGPAMPDGDIPMRLAAAPDRRLVAPVPRWPTTDDVPEYDVTAGVGVGEQVGLLL